MARKRRMRKTGEWARIFGKQNAQPAPEPVIVAEAIIEEPVIAEPIIAEPVAEAKPVTKKRTTKKKTTKKKPAAKKKVEITESIAAPSVQEEVSNGLIEIEEPKPKRRSWFKKVTSDED
jgi:uncharacterized membrane-anchored protein